MKIASWNVNSLNVRLPHLQRWLDEAKPDVVALQETKQEDHKFPEDALLELGYRSMFCGQKTYNGVAIVSRLPFAGECVTAIPGFEDPQKRVLAATVGGHTLTGLRIPSPFVVRTFDPPVTALIGHAVRGVARLGKRLVLRFDDDLYAVIHLMIAGRLRWKPPCVGRSPRG